MSGRAGSAAAGYAVATVLLLLVGLTGLAHGALLLAERERVASALEARLIARRMLARAAVRTLRASDTLPTVPAEGLVLASGERPPWSWSTEVRPLGRDLLLLVGVGRMDALTNEDRIGRLISALDPSTRVAATKAVVEAGEAEPGADPPSTDGWLVAPGSAAAVCRAELAALDSLGAVTPPPIAFVRRAGEDRAVPELGVLPGDSALARLSVRIAGTVHPAPAVSFGECVGSASNWGSPSDPLGPCGRRMEVAGADGDVRVEGGEGQGVLVAAGSVTLAGTRFDGLVLAGGDLVLEGGATLVGSARVFGAFRNHGGRVVGSACAAARALRAAVALRLPYALPDAAPIRPL